MTENKKKTQDNPTYTNVLEQNFNYDDIEDIPRETIMNIYGDDFENLTSLLGEEEMKVKDFFSEIPKA